MPTSSTTFTPPAAPLLTVEADIAASAIRLSWEQTAVAQVDFRGYRVYRSLNGVDFELLAVFDLVDQLQYDDFMAPLNTTAVYRVTASNVDAESDPGEGSDTLESSTFWVVEPNDSSLTFPVPKLRAASLTSPKVMDVYSPIGRPGKLAVGDVVQAEDGEVSFLAMPDNPGAVALAKRAQAKMDGGIILKATDGSVWAVAFGDMTRSFSSTGVQELTLRFTGVG